MASARKQHPGWNILLHSGDVPRGNSAWDEVAPLGELRSLTPESAAEDLPISSADYLNCYRRINYPAGRANLQRLSVLWKLGGVYLDLDTVCLRPLDDLLTEGAFVGEEIVWRHDNERVERGFRPKMAVSAAAFGLSWAAARLGLWSSHSLPERGLRCLWGAPELNNAVIGATPRHPWIKLLLEMALEADPTVRFSLGPALFNRAWHRAQETGVPLPVRHAPECFYVFPPSQTVRFFGSCRRDVLPSEARLLHWCSSNHHGDMAHLTREWAGAHREESFWASAVAAISD